MVLVSMFQFYADDTQLYVHLTHKNVASALDKQSCCPEDVKRCNITQSVQMATHLHGHTLDLVLTPADRSGISNV